MFSLWSWTFLFITSSVCKNRTYITLFHCYQVYNSYLNLATYCNNVLHSNSSLQPRVQPRILQTVCSCNISLVSWLRTVSLPFFFSFMILTFLKNVGRLFCSNLGLYNSSLFLLMKCIFVRKAVKMMLCLLVHHIGRHVISWCWSQLAWPLWLMWCWTGVV